MQVRHDDGMVGDHGVKQFLGDVAGLHGAHPQPAKAGHLGDGIKQVGKRRRAGAALFASQCRLVPVGPDEDAGENDLAVAEVDEPGGLLDRDRDRLGTERPANPRDDASSR